MQINWIFFPTKWQPCLSMVRTPDKLAESATKERERALLIWWKVFVGKEENNLPGSSEYKVGSKI